MAKRKKSRKGSAQSSSSDGAVLIKGADVITMDDVGRVGQFDIRIEGRRITAIAPRVKSRLGDRVIKAKGLVAMPGLVQAHVHTCQSLMRGQADNMELLTWLQSRIWPLEGAMRETDVRDAARLGIAELLLGGTTSILDMGTVRHTDAIFTAAKRLGIRFTGGKTIMDRGQGLPAGLRETTEEAIQNSVALCDAWHGRSHGRLRYAFSPRFALSSSEEAMRACVSEARQRGALLHTHAAENSEEVQLVRGRTGMGNIEYLHSIGFTGHDVLLAHCVWVSLEERKIMRETGTRVVHCPSANLKLGSGIARIAEYIAEGIEVAIGADGAACNDRLDGFEELRLLALLHKVRSGPTALPAQTALRIATRGGALALGLDDVGCIEVDKRADIILLDLQRPHTYPPSGDLLARVVYSARASDVRTVIVDGKVLVEDGELLSADLKSILAASKRAAEQLAARVD